MTVITVCFNDHDFFVSCFCRAVLKTNEFRNVTEEEKKINSLKDSHEWDSSETKDQLSLSSTSLPEIGIHEPQFNVKGDFTPFNATDSLTQSTVKRTQSPPIGVINLCDYYVTGEAIYPAYEPAGNPSSSTTAVPIQPVDVNGNKAKEDETNPPIDIEANSQEIEGKDETTLFVPDDDVIIETPALANTDSASGKLQTNPAPPVVLLLESTTTMRPTSTISTTVADVDVSSERPRESTTVVPLPLPDPVVIAVPEPDTSGFVPVQTQEDLDYEMEQSTDSQTEVLSEVLPTKPVDPVPAVDLAPWKPIDGTIAVPPVNTDDEVQDRSIVDGTSPADAQQSVVSVEKKKSSAVVTSTTVKTTSTTPSISRVPEEVSQVPVEIVKWEAPMEPSVELEESTEFAQMQDLGNMALLLPEDRIRTAKPTVVFTTEKFPFIVSVHSVPASSQCIRRQLPFCRGVLPYSETILPNWVGDNTESERNFSVPYFEIIAESEW